MDKCSHTWKLMAEIASAQKVLFVLFGFRAYLALHLERSPLSLVLLKGDIAVFSESGSGWALGTSRRQWLVLAQRRNTANERFPARPKGAKQMTQYGVTAPVLLKDDIAVFSESGRGWALGTPCRQWHVLAKRRNTANDRFPACPKGATQMIQYGVTALNKDRAIVCGLCLVLDHLDSSEHVNITLKEYCSHS